MQLEGTRWGSVDIDLSCTDFKGNPYDLRLWATVSGPSGSGPALRIPGFYRGSGRWTARFMPAAAGAWSFRTESDIGGLDGRSGTVSVVEAAPGARGRLQRDPERPRALRWEDGSECFLIGFEADWLATLDQGGDDVPKARSLIESLAANGFNHVLMNVYAHDVPWPGDLGRASKYDFSRPAAWPFGGTHERPDYETLNPGYFETVDRVVECLRQRNVACHLMIYVWNKKVSWPPQGSPADRRFFDYVVARYQGCSNIVWDVSKEALTYGACDAAYIEGKCGRIRELDAHGHLLTVHDREFCEQRPDLVDVVAVQDWRSDLYPLMSMLRERHLDKPVFNIEHGGYEESPFMMAPGDYQDPVACLERNWLCVFAGAYSTYYWQGCSWNIVCYEPESLPPEKRPRWRYFRVMQEFFARYPFRDFMPVPTGRMVSSGYVLHDGGDTLLILKPRESYCTHLRGFADVEAVTVSWLHPLSGEWSQPETIAMERFLALRSPWSEVFAVACVRLRRKPAGRP